MEKGQIIPNGAVLDTHEMSKRIKRMKDRHYIGIATRWCLLLRKTLNFSSVYVTIAR